MTEVSEKERFLKVEKWLKNLLSCEEVPPYEVNDETLSIFEKMMANQQAHVNHQDMLKQQITQEKLEFNAEKEVTNEILSAVDMEPNRSLNPKATKFLKSFCTGMEVVETVLPTLQSMIIAVTELHDDLNQTQISISAAETACQQLDSDFEETKELKLRLEKQYAELEAKLYLEQKNVEALKKSTKFHSLKKKDYEKKIAECGEALKSVGFSSNFSHTEVVQLGQRFHSIETALKPRKLQLESYRNLPPDINLARLKLRQKLEELKGIEEELHQIFQTISFS